MSDKPPNEWTVEEAREALALYSAMPPPNDEIFDETVRRVLLERGCGVGRTIDYPRRPLTDKQRAALLDGLAKAGASIAEIDVCYTGRYVGPGVVAVAFKDTRKPYPLETDVQLLKAVSELCK